VGHIVTIDVLEGWRRRRVGSLLMDAAEHWAGEQKLLFVYLETAENNTAAQRFFAARGYRKVNSVENYYSDGAAAWVMMKRV
jgi:ribosomal-protein-alanine N-acetyltransferase